MKTLRIVKLAAVVAAFALLAPHAASAGSSTGTLSVSATVVAKCTVANQTLGFGNWDAITYGSANLDATATISFTCTKGSSGVNVTADNGANSANASGTTRAMSDGAGNYLSYELYTDSGHSTIWNTTNKFTPSFASGTSATATVYGRVPSGQSASVGAYSDSVTMTINF